MEDSESVFSVFSWFWFELRMVLISVTSCCSTYIGNSVVIYHKKSSDLIIGNLLFQLGTLLDNFSTVTGPFGLLGFMGHVMVCSSKGKYGNHTVHTCTQHNPKWTLLLKCYKQPFLSTFTNCEKGQLALSCLAVYPSAWNNSAPIV